MRHTSTRRKTRHDRGIGCRRRPPVWTERVATSHHLRNIPRRLEVRRSTNGNDEALRGVEGESVKPEFVDNRELSMADALCGHLDWLEAAYKEPAEISIATGYFNPEGFSILA